MYIKVQYTYCNAQYMVYIIFYMTLDCYIV